MTEKPTISDKQAEYLKERLGINLKTSEQIANELLDWFVERCQGEDINADDMYAISQSFADKVEEAYKESSL